MAFENTTDPKKAAANNRVLAQQRADELNQRDKDLANGAESNARGYQGFLDPIEQQLASGQGGYTPEEAAGIQGSEGLNKLPTSAADLQGNFLTGDEQGAMKGDTGSYGDYFSPDQMHSSLVGDQGMQDAAFQDLHRGLGNAIDPNQLKQSQDYRDTAKNQLGANQNMVGGSLNDEGSAVRGAIDPKALRQSGAAAQNEVMTPEEEQRMVTGAGISEGVRNDAAVGSLQRQALAAGSSPMGVAAYRARMNHETAADAGDAMTKARIAAQQARAGEALSSEQQRLGAESGATGLQAGTELDLGKQNVAGGEYLGGQALDQANAEEANRQAAQQYLTGAQLHSAETEGAASMANAQAKTAQEQGQNQFIANSGTALREAQDKANADRAAGIAANRQTTATGNQATQFGQGLAVNNAASGRAATVGNARIGQQDTGLGLQAGQQGQQNANAQAAYGREGQTYATQTGAQNAAAGIGQAASQNPTTFDKIAGGLTGAAGAAAAFLDEGGIATEPTVAVVGENGPEKVMQMNPYRARMPQPAAPVKRRMPMRYGQEVA